MRNLSVSVVGISSIAFLLACTKHNPASCCTAADQCMSEGLDGIFLCPGGDVCDPGGTCVAPQCSTASDCPAGDDCVGELCESGSDGSGSGTPPPIGLSYGSNFVLYDEGIAITPNMPSLSDGVATAYAVTPALPSGLQLNTITGVIDGTPATETTIDLYTVTATTTEGSASDTISIAVNSRGVIATGSSYACARANEGAYCWGIGLKGSLGGNSTSSESVPSQVTGLSVGIEQLAAKGLFTCAVVSGSATCWGDGVDGDLGNNAAAESNVPVPVSSLSSGVQSLATGSFFACAVVNGGAECWGANASGQLGDGTTTQSDIPVPVTGLGTGVQAIAAGADHACALLVDGSLECWGDNGQGELGNNSSTSSSVPVPVLGLGSGVEAVTAGQEYTCAIVSGGAVMCWGTNGVGQLGDGNFAASTVPGAVVGLGSNVQSISAGIDHTCALVNGGAMCWGDNGGALGDGSNATSPVPVAVSGLGSGVQMVSAGNDASCALVNGMVWCWGGNFFGDLRNRIDDDKPCTCRCFRYGQ